MRETLTLRPATEDDADFLLRLRNERAVVAASRTNQPVDEATHRAWLAESLSSSTRRLLIVCDAGVPIGQARLDEASGDEWVSIAMTRQQRSRGRGAEVVRALQRLAGGDLLAEVRSDNPLSLRLFQSAGFEECAVDEGFAQLKWRNPADRGSDSHDGIGKVGDHAD